MSNVGCPNCTWICYPTICIVCVCMCNYYILGIQDCHAVSYHDMCSIYLIQHAQKKKKRIMDIKRKESDWTAMFSEVRSSNVSGSPSNIDATSRQISQNLGTVHLWLCCSNIGFSSVKKEGKMSKSVIWSPFCSRN